MGRPVAIVTGGSSGIGLALVKHLASLEWKVFIADLQPPKENIQDCMFIPTDILSWDQQASMFEQAYRWSGRLDFCALNAGIDDRDDIFSTLSHDLHRPPRQPNTKTFEINMTGTYYGIKLAAHYMTIRNTESGKLEVGGKIVVTSSGTGLYPNPAIPQYSATKAGLIGLVRALARNPNTVASNVRINTVCPAIVDTPGIPHAILERIPVEQITPMSIIIKCFDALANLSEIENEDWVENGPTGATVEGQAGSVIWHDYPRTMGGDGAKLDRVNGAFNASLAAYGERNRRFALGE